MKTLLVIFEDTTSIRHAYQTPPVYVKEDHPQIPPIYYHPTLPLLLFCTPNPLKLILCICSFLYLQDFEICMFFFGPFLIARKSLFDGERRRVFLMCAGKQKIRFSDLGWVSCPFSESNKRWSMV